jgi:hypothetical protein
MKRKLEGIFVCEYPVAYTNSHGMLSYDVSDFPEMQFNVGELLMWEGRKRIGQDRIPFAKFALVTKIFHDKLAIQALVEGKLVAFHNTQSTIHSNLTRVEESQ